MARLNFSFANPSRHGSTGGGTFDKPSRTAREADQAGARWEASERSRQSGRTETGTGRRGWFGRRG